MPSSKAPQSKPAPAVPPSEFDEERIPFDVVVRKLANTPAPHKTAKAPAATAKKTPKKTAKKP